MLWIIPAIIVSYLIGSIPTAYIFGRITKGIDIREFGSGNIGATNALRVLGKGPGITVLVLDMLKGLLPVVFLGDFMATRIPLSAEAIRIIIALSCICGHIWTVFLNLKGGKGVATTFGVLLGLGLRISSIKWVILCVVVAWAIVFLITRMVSLASVISVLAMPLFMLFLGGSAPLVLCAIILAAIIIIRHASNLKRIFQGKEPRLNLKNPSK